MSERFCEGDERMRRTFFFIFEDGVDQAANVVASLAHLRTGPPRIRVDVSRCLGLSHLHWGRTK